MEFPAASAHRGLVPWLGLLLAVFLLAFWIPPTTAKFAIDTTDAAEGDIVVLRTRNTPPNVARFMWYRGEKTISKNFILYVTHLRRYRTGSAYSGREGANLKGILIIKNVTLKDTGIYTVVAVLRNSKIKAAFGQLNVYRPVSVPTVLASITTATEKKDAVVMTCQTNAISTNWLFNAESLRLRKRMKLSQDHRTLTIDPVRREDAGNYQCKVSNPISSIESAPVKLDVKY